MQTPKKQIITTIQKQRATMIDLSKYDKLIVEGTTSNLAEMEQRRNRIGETTKQACLLMAEHMLKLNDINEAIKELFIISDAIDPLNINDIKKCNETIFKLFRQICAEKVITEGFYTKILSFPFKELFSFYDKASKFFMEHKASIGNKDHLDKAADFPFSFIDDEVIRNKARDNLRKILDK